MNVPAPFLSREEFARRCGTNPVFDAFKQIKVATPLANFAEHMISPEYVGDKVVRLIDQSVRLPPLIVPTWRDPVTVIEGAPRNLLVDRQWALLDPGGKVIPAEHIALSHLLEATGVGTNSLPPAARKEIQLVRQVETAKKRRWVEIEAGSRKNRVQFTKCGSVRVQTEPELLAAFEAVAPLLRDPLEQGNVPMTICRQEAMKIDDVYYHAVRVRTGDAPRIDLGWTDIYPKDERSQDQLTRAFLLINGGLLRESGFIA
jgi:hypothetical protein